MNFYKRFKQFRRERRIRRMPASDLPEVGQEGEPRVLHIPTEIPEQDVELLERVGFSFTAVDRTTRIGRGGHGSVFKAVANERAVRYHSVSNIRGEYFDKIFEGKVWRTVPIGDTVRVNDIYHAELLVGKEVAVKFVNMKESADPREQHKYRREANIMSMLYHPNVVRIYDIVVIVRRLYILMEYCPDGSLNEMIFRGRLSEQLCRSFTQQLTAGLLYLHSLSATHGDIHGNNIVLIRRESNEDDIDLKYVDFGVANIAGNEAQVMGDLRMFGNVLFQFAANTDFDDPVMRQRLDDASDRLTSGQFMSLSDAIQEYEFLHPEEHVRMRSTKHS